MPAEAAETAKAQPCKEREKGCKSQDAEHFTVFQHA